MQGFCGGAITPTVWLTKNSQCQESVSVKNPPRVGPKVDDRLRMTEMIAMTVASRCRRGRVGDHRHQ
jgi:hypothetical protein